MKRIILIKYECVLECLYGTWGELWRACLLKRLTFYRSVYRQAPRPLLAPLPHRLTSLLLSLSLSGFSLVYVTVGVVLERPYELVMYVGNSVILTVYCIVHYVQTVDDSTPDVPKNIRLVSLLFFVLRLQNNDSFTTITLPSSTAVLVQWKDLCQVNNVLHYMHSEFRCSL